MQDFHYKWRRSVDQVIRANDRMNGETSEQLNFLRSKLILLRDCLREIGTIEANYASRLKEFSSKWLHAGQRNYLKQHQQAQKEEESITRRLSITLLGSSTSTTETSVEDADAEENKRNDGDSSAEEDKGFFSAISRANEEIAEHKGAFAAALNELLPQGIFFIVAVIMPRILSM